MLYTGKAKGTDELVEEMGKHFGMQMEVIVPPNHPRAQYVSPSTVEVLVLPILILIRLLINCCNAITKLLKRLIPSLPLAHCKRMPNESEGEPAGPSNWHWIKAEKSTCLTSPVKLGTDLKTIITSATILLVW